MDVGVFVEVEVGDGEGVFVGVNVGGTKASTVINTDFSATVSFIVT